jgi:hypothetical protein
MGDKSPLLPHFQLIVLSNYFVGHGFLPAFKQIYRPLSMCIVAEILICMGADTFLARPGRKRLTGHLQPRRNWPT